jgi:putative colanic acid biosysnthesis UDP-glucose lipid carrier transferase
MRESLHTPTLRFSANSPASSALDAGRVAPIRRLEKVLRSTSEPGGSTLLTEIVNPAAIVVTLFLSVLIYGQRLTPPYFALAALAFILSFQIVSRPDFSRSYASGIINFIQHRVFTEWMLVSAALLLLAFALKVTELFSRRVILTWFVMAPFAVVGTQELLRRFAAFAALRGSIAQSHIIVGANPVGRRLAQRLQATPHRGAFKGFSPVWNSGRAIAR